MGQRNRNHITAVRLRLIDIAARANFYFTAKTPHCQAWSVKVQCSGKNCEELAIRHPLVEQFKPDDIEMSYDIDEHRDKTQNEVQYLNPFCFA